MVQYFTKKKNLSLEHFLPHNKSHTFHKNDLLFTCTFDNNIRYNFGGNSPHSTDIFKIQKQIIWIMKKSISRDSCRLLFKRLQNLPLHSQYIFSVLLFVVKNKDV